MSLMYGDTRSYFDGHISKHRLALATVTNSSRLISHPVSSARFRTATNHSGFAWRKFAMTPLNNAFKVECPTRSKNQMTLFEVACEIGCRLSSIFARDANGRRFVYGGTERTF